MDIISSPIIESFQNDTNKEASNDNPEELPTETENSSANSSLNKMESLIVEEDDDDEDNPDDGLGTESLRISGSEGEDTENISPVRRKKRPTQQIIESDEENDGEGKSDKVEPPNSDLSSGEDDKIQDSVQKSQVAEKQKKFSALIDSDSEPEEATNDIQEDSQGDEVKKTSKANKKKKNKKDQKKKKVNSSSESSDSENDEEVSSKSKGKKKQSGISNLVDSDSESSSNASSEGEGRTEQDKTPAAQKPKKQQRASAKKAMDEMQAIQSETQRLYRETQVNIPYHKPKRHTLKEFLTRHTIVKPTLNQTGKSLKMTPEELEEYAKQLEERAKEATEFFKSESEDELKDVEENESTEKEPDAVIPMDTSTTEPNEPEAQPDASKPLNTEEIDQILQEHEFISQPSTQELLEIGVTHNSESETHPTPSTSTAIEVTPKEPEPQPSSSSSRPSALAELKRRLLAEKNIPLVPTLKGDANMIIDFETGDMFARKPTGVETLFQRFIMSNKNNKKKPEEPTPSQELQETLKVAVIQESNKEKEPKPGAAYIKLKENLRTLISRKRKQEFQKKIEENKEEEDEYKKCCGLDEDDEEDEEDEERKSEKKTKKTQHEIVIDEEENEIDQEEYENEDEEEDDQAQDRNKDEENEEDPEEVEEDNDEENQENQVENDDGDDDESESSSSEEEDTEDPSTKKHRVIKAFEDSDDEVNPDLNGTSTSVLFAEEAQKNPEEIEDELLDLCSGKFAETQRATVISQIPITQTPGNVTETQLEDLCSGVFNEETPQIEQTQGPAKSQKTAMRILSSDEEKEPDEEKDVAQMEGGRKVKKLTKKKKKHIKLGFSDDEDEDEPNAAAEEELEEEEEVEEEIPQTFIDYDSEENEIEVQMSKKDCVKQANAFLEKEAELSESEWGSADEDEQNLDRYDNELGDEDEFDQQKLHTELEQIHMRKVLDDDIREVKKIQEMLFDDEEADGVGRQRKFRWKNVESGFSLDDPAGGGANNDDQVDSADDEEEIKWRKMRFEREQFLKEKTKEEIIADVSKTELGKKLLHTMQQTEIDDSKYVIEKEVMVAKEYKPVPFYEQVKNSSKLRHSMLNYDKEILAKMVKAIEKSGDYVTNSNEQIMRKASNTGNFVFIPLTEEENELRKRKAEEASKGNVAKKKKTNVSTKPLFLDKLL
ncbi:claspin [Eupeodes corollae]|uniref:claspin n=1 Tax=Eupeodes corollae TaxID=290404 RepID=UPI002491A299|nr:claspin [Eupeodes corollae]